MQLQKSTTEDRLKEVMRQYIGELQFKSTLLEADNPIIQWLSRNPIHQETFVEKCIGEKIHVIMLAKYIALLDISPKQFKRFFACTIIEARNAKLLAENVEYFKTIRENESKPIQEKCSKLGIDYKKALCIKIFLQEICDGSHRTYSYPEQKFSNFLSSINLLKFYIPIFGADEAFEILAKRQTESRGEKEQGLRIIKLAITIFYSPNDIKSLKKTFGKEFSDKDFKLAQYLIDNLEYFKKLKVCTTSKSTGHKVKCSRRASAEKHSLKV